VSAPLWCSHIPALRAGGGIYSSGELTLINSTITGNTASFGGGIYSCCGGTLRLIHTSVTENTPDNVLEAPGPFPE
jgi:hypothetical protein